jgi:hypothetical protein
MNKVAVSIPCAGSEFCDAGHVCAFFDTNEEAYRMLLPFIEDGFKCGDKAARVVDPDQRPGHPQRLAGVGIDATRAQQRGRLELRIDAETYVRDGGFDADKMLQVVIIGGIPQPNRFFVPPEQFLRELHERRAGQGSLRPL